MVLLFPKQNQYNAPPVQGCESKKMDLISRDCRVNLLYVLSGGSVTPWRSSALHPPMNGKVFVHFQLLLK